MHNRVWLEVDGDGLTVLTNSESLIYPQQFSVRDGLEARDRGTGNGVVESYRVCNEMDGAIAEQEVAPAGMPAAEALGAGVARAA